MAPSLHVLPDPSANLAELRAEVHGCHRCDLWRHATQAVFGEGREDARLMFVGEQPGDAEDLAGRPFVGPAGRLLDRAIEAAGIDRDRVYVTNAVKHFKWVPRGKRRLHSKPGASEVQACHLWLEGEVHAVRPSIVVCLGATAVQAVCGPGLRVTALRGRWISAPMAPKVLVTVHPSSVLRQRTDPERHDAFASFVADLEVAAVDLRGTVASNR